ncbi:helix-turn-helix domain-containing protein [Limobrevibacterium gyesilva]|uniref:Helix-turn-helix transcriptional regulator n=1 Tax=Limobrevibacterium gyesilva TaxID=2991712 RepID=A0AA41YTH9_9PROT|nr:helix-turn-helix transcriptional regulator [Limobrevibacterium gyesilva]MCW3476273.1 helix-turn-helix transcriptional regulator [Limobrevibacterium gyesilva]
MDRHGLKPAELARQTGLSNANTIYNFLNGRSRALSQKTYEKLARVMPGETLDSLTGGAGPSGARGIPVRAEACAGRLNPSFDLPLDHQSEAAMPVDAGMLAAGVFGVAVGRPGAELLYPEGTVLACLPFLHCDEPPATGRRLIVQRIRDGHVEVMVRELEVAGGKAWLWPRSTHPDHQQPIACPWPNDGRMWKVGEDRFSIPAVVVGSYQPEGRSSAPWTRG